MRRGRCVTFVAVMIIVPVILITSGTASAVPSSSAKVAATAQTFTVSSTTGWQRTSLYLTVGQRFKVQYISGCWTVDHRNFPCVGPQGYSDQEDARIYQDCKFDGNNNYGVLYGDVGAVANGAFPVGIGGTFTATAPGSHVTGAGDSGYLYLRINDSDACLGDNAGSVTMRINVIPVASPPTCAAVHFIGFHGTGQSEADPKYLGMGQTVLQTWKSLASHGTVRGGMVVSAVNPFPAVDLPSTNDVVKEVTQGWAYAQVAIAAARTATVHVQRIAASCPNTKFAFVGYSLGALVAHMTLQNLSQSKFNMANVAAVVFFGDPIYPQVKPTSPREGVGRAIGLWGNGAPYVPAGLGKRTLSICLSYDLQRPVVSKARVAYDPVCLVQKPIKTDVNLQNCVNEKTRNSVLCPHTQYARFGEPKFAANWLARILNVH